MKSLLLLTVIAAICSNVLVKTEDNLNTQIKNGHPSKDTEFPFAAIEVGHYTSGIIVGDRYILTLKRYLRRWIGKQDVLIRSTVNNYTRHKIRCVIEHPSADILLVQLEDTLKFSDTIQPIALSKKNPEVNATYVQVFANYRAATWMALQFAREIEGSHQDVYIPATDFQETELIDYGGPVARKEGDSWFLYGVVLRAGDDRQTVAVNAAYLNEWVTEQMNNFQSSICWE